MLEFKNKKGVATKKDWDDAAELVRWFESDSCEAPNFTKEKVRSYFANIESVESIDDDGWK